MGAAMKAMKAMAAMKAMKAMKKKAAMKAMKAMAAMKAMKAMKKKKAMKAMKAAAPAPAMKAMKAMKKKAAMKAMKAMAAMKAMKAMKKKKAMKAMKAAAPAPAMKAMKAMRFYGLCLGPHRKYSACLYEGAEPKWPGNKLQKDAARLLPKAEKDSLDQVASRGDITQATKAILDCGCGWGSASLYLADRFRNAQVVGVSNSHSQRRYIMGQVQERGLTNLQIVTLDLSKEPLTKALEALQSRLPGQYFERGVSIEMFEHMKNYKALFEKIT